MPIGKMDLEWRQTCIIFLPTQAYLHAHRSEKVGELKDLIMD